uniref:HTH_48 domain-containing protein n=1 Tax=Angiostrongylus cantonensis TaxID=6313 RepID=A0A0K0DKF0_ANGCA
MSPYATFLTEEQQKTLHELVVEARHEGADEGTVKEHINKYINDFAIDFSNYRNTFSTFFVCHPELNFIIIYIIRNPKRLLEKMSGCH